MGHGQVCSKAALALVSRTNALASPQGPVPMFHCLFKEITRAWQQSEEESFTLVESSAFVDAAKRHEAAYGIAGHPFKLVRLAQAR